MSGASQVMTEDDDRPGAAIPLPGGGSNFDMPQREPNRSAEPEFEIVETDSDFRPLHRDEQQVPVQREAPLTEENVAEQPLVGNEGVDEFGNRHRPRSKSAQHAARKAGRDRTISENAQLRAELEQLRAQVGGIEPRLTEIDEGRIQAKVSDLDRRIQEANRQVVAARRQMAEAMTTNDPELLNAALDARDTAMISANHLTVEKNMLVTNDPLGRTDVRRPVQQVQPQQQPQAQPLTSQARAFMAEFQADNDWINVVNGRPTDFDSELALRLDNAVANDGFNPGTQDYWDELQSRIDRYMPHRSAAPARAAPQPRPQPRQQQAQPERRGPMVGGASERAPAARANQVYLSPERKDSLISAGVLERDGRTVADKSKFNRIMKSYQEFDRANGTARN